MVGGTEWKGERDKTKATGGRGQGGKKRGREGREGGREAVEEWEKGKEKGGNESSED